MNKILKEIKALEKQLGIYLSCIDTTKESEMVIIRDYLTKKLIIKSSNNE